MADIQLIHGDCLERLKTIEENSVDAVVTDPPYGLAFMGKHWDYDVPSVEIWKECLRVLKPGGYLLSFAGTRTYHKIACAIEDAGFEIRDMVDWVYGSGFPKSLNIGKAVGTSEWEGWGTALKPAHEPICMARKPLSEKTVAENVLKWGTGGINIDGCRIEHNEMCRMMKAQTDDDVMTGGGKYGQAGRRNDVLELKPAGRFPANFIHDGSQEVLDLFPNSGGSAARFFYCAKASKAERNMGCEGLPLRHYLKANKMGGEHDTMLTGSGNPRDCRKHNNHPTVKPVALMEYLIKLVSREGATILDPFAGSGTTGIACKNLNRNAILIEKDAEYVEIAKRRNY